MHLGQTTQSVRTILIRALYMMLFVFTAISISDARAQEMSISVDEAQLIRLNEKAAQIIVGNPSIADVFVQSGKLIVVTGKSAGRTNLIVLNASDKAILSRQMNVTPSTQRQVTLHRGSSRYSYHCGEICNAAIVVGDNDKYTAAVAASTSQKFSIAKTASKDSSAQN